MVAAWVLLLAAGLDRLLGDPPGWPHPVRGMGLAIASSTRILQQRVRHPLGRRWAGAGLAVGLVLASGLAAWLLVRGAAAIQPLLGSGIEAVLVASCLAGRSLRAAAEEIMQPLAAGQLAQACERLGQYVGRDTDGLSPDEIRRATVETVAENATDGVMAPLFYAIAGAFLPGIGSAPLAMAYKAASTLDSMVGYRREPYTDLGWASARLEDGLSWLPCRLTMVALALRSGKLKRVWRWCHRDAPRDPSPNAGWSECAYAAALGIQLGGPNWYGGIRTDKPLLGEPLEPIAPVHVERALRLTRDCALAGLLLGVAGVLGAQVL